jgi:proteasome lid subunit RPN8/RPN11
MNGLRPLVELDYVFDPDTLFNLQLHAAKEAPYEACGVIHIDESITLLPNVFEGNRRSNFAMDVDFDFSVPAFAIWHSHPGGRPFMSDSDHLGMTEMYRAGIKLPWVIVAGGRTTMWSLK